MLHLSIMELFLRVFPDTILFITGAHIFSSASMDKIKMLKSIVFITFTIYLIRALPITYGIHTLLGFVAITIVVTGFHKIELIKSLRAVFIVILIQYISEMLNMAWIQLCISQDLETIFANPTTKILYGIPSQVLSGIILFIFYIRLKRRKECISNGQ